MNAALPLSLELRAQAAGEDARDGRNQPDEVAEEGAERYLNWLAYCWDGGQ